jgi:hypothetical protein
VGVERVLLARFEGIQAGKDARRLEQGALAHSVRAPSGAVADAYDRWSFHASPHSCEVPLQSCG